MPYIESLADCSVIVLDCVVSMCIHFCYFIDYIVIVAYEINK